MGGWKYEDFIKAFDITGVKYLDDAPIEFIKRYAKEYAELQIGDLNKQINDWRRNLMEEVKDRKEQVRLNGELVKALRHEVFGNEPCNDDCEPGGWRKCLGCDRRAKAAIKGTSEKRKGVWTAEEVTKINVDAKALQQELCEHKWAHIEDHHVICEKCKHTADLCWTCESEKTKTSTSALVCLKCNPQ